ncbi:unnamed protein product [Prorocentrum cordatum]|uniref:Transmembrane protein n=1 Tax=Prorocentrum cordatum TaxID=2364126 RepID=A0ABN9U096_9DINO|nr:unnamed protein product [Polarella glacialis]
MPSQGGLGPPGSARAAPTLYLTGLFPPGLGTRRQAAAEAQAAEGAARFAPAVATMSDLRARYRVPRRCLDAQPAGAPCPAKTASRKRSPHAWKQGHGLRLPPLQPVKTTSGRQRGLVQRPQEEQPPKAEAPGAPASTPLEPGGRPQGTPIDGPSEALKRAQDTLREALERAQEERGEARPPSQRGEAAAADAPSGGLGAAGATERDPSAEGDASQLEQPGLHRLARLQPVHPGLVDGALEATADQYEDGFEDAEDAEPPAGALLAMGAELSTSAKLKPDQHEDPSSDAEDAFEDDESACKNDEGKSEPRSAGASTAEAATAAPNRCLVERPRGTETPAGALPAWGAEQSATKADQHEDPSEDEDAFEDDANPSVGDESTSERRSTGGLPPEAADRLTGRSEGTEPRTGAELASFAKPDRQDDPSEEVEESALESALGGRYSHSAYSSAGRPSERTGALQAAVDGEQAPTHASPDQHEDPSEDGGRAPEAASPRAASPRAVGTERSDASAASEQWSTGVLSPKAAAGGPDKRFVQVGVLPPVASEVSDASLASEQWSTGVLSPKAVAAEPELSFARVGALPESPSKDEGVCEDGEGTSEGDEGKSEPRPAAEATGTSAGALLALGAEQSETKAEQYEGAFEDDEGLGPPARTLPTLGAGQFTSAKSDQYEDAFEDSTEGRGGRPETGLPAASEKLARPRAESPSDPYDEFEARASWLGEQLAMGIPAHVSFGNAANGRGKIKSESIRTAFVFTYRVISTRRSCRFSVTYMIAFVGYLIVGMAVLLALAVPLRLRAAAAAPRCTGPPKEQPEAAGAVAAGVGGLGELWISGVASSKRSFAALLAYDRLTRSWSYLLLNSLSVLVFLWGGAGVAFVIHDAVPDEVECPAKWIRRAAHSYAFIYVAMLVWSLACLGPQPVLHHSAQNLHRRARGRGRSAAVLAATVGSTLRRSTCEAESGPESGEKEKEGHPCGMRGAIFAILFGASAEGPAAPRPARPGSAALASTAAPPTLLLQSVEYCCK